MSTLALAAAVATTSRPTLTVDLQAVAANTRLFARRATGGLMAVVKADGFGHGAAGRRAHRPGRTAPTRLGVTSLDEAFALRAAGLSRPGPELAQPRRRGLRRPRVAQDVEVAVPTRRAPRGDRPDRAGRRASTCTSTPAWPATAPRRRSGRDSASPRARAERQGPVRVVGLMGHLPCADEPGRRRPTPLGRARFAWALATARGPGLRRADRHLAATAATLTDPLSHHTLCRVGAGLVGIDPSGTTHAAPRADAHRAAGQRPRRCARAPAVGYGHTWIAPTATQLGLLPLGYADGLPRAASGRAEVLVAGVRRPLVGRISMDMAVVDLGDLAVPSSATPSPSSGPATPASRRSRDWADWSDTIEHEIVTGLGSGSSAWSVPRRPCAASMRTRVAVIGGGQNCEHEVSLASAAAVAGRARPVERTTRPPDHRPRRGLARRRAVGRSAWPGPSTCSGPAPSSCPRCTDRAARTAPSPRCATSPASRTSGPASAPGALAMDKWATKLVRRGARRRHGAGRAAHAGHRARRTAGPTRSWSSRSRPARATA